MYYYLHGLITMHTKDSIVVECHGVGYDCLVSHPDEYEIGENMFVYVSYYSHEDDQFFIGFKTLEEKILYGKLTSVKGIGPKTAINALSQTSVGRLSDAINNSDENFLVRLPGIGKKNASQIILDLKGKLTNIDLNTRFGDKNLDLAYDGLKNLGFKDNEIRQALNGIAKTGLSVEEYMTTALRILNTR
ncbi:MAG: Holliday junction branch migration protein RuvA [Bacilli bacterium]